MTHLTATMMRNTWLAEMPSLAAKLALWRQRARGRAELARLGERELHDIGVSRAEASVEANKPFWQA